MIEAPCLIAMSVARAHYKQANRLPLCYLTILKVAIKPATVKLQVKFFNSRGRPEVDVAGVCTCIPGMRPRSDQQFNRRLLYLAKCNVITEGAAKKDVVPATNMQHRSVRSLVVMVFPVKRNGPPVIRVVRLRKLCHKVVFISRRNRQWVLSAAKRQRVIPVCNLFNFEMFTHYWIINLQRNLTKRPGQLTAQFERTAMTHRMIPCVSHAAFVHKHGFQSGRIEFGCISLGVSGIRCPKHSHPAV